jgi:hypothetical protein
MARSTATNVENNFSKGLITEATGLNFPENACTETYNCIFHHTGEVTRRPGIDYEGSFEVTEQDMDDNSVREFIWKAVALNGEFTFLVLQIGSILNFYQLETTSLSPSKKSFTVDLNDYKVASAPEVEPITCSFSSGHGYLFVAHPYCEPFYVKYDSETDDITVTAVVIEVRDFEGVEDGLRDDERPATLSVEHHYNLLNQGWDVVTALTQNQKTYVNGSPLGWWQVPCPPAAGRNDYPSNCDIWWTSNTVMRPQVDQDGNIIFPVPVEAFFPQEVDKNKRMATRAPNGHFKLTAWHYDRSGVIYNNSDHGELPGIDGIPVETAGYQRPSSTAFYTGRVWWAGINSGKFATRIYFSKVIERDGDFGTCYQINDPTGEEAADLVASDGGMIVIPEISTVIKLQQVGSDLYVFATNGTWRIGGSAGTGFLATDHAITKVSSIGALSETSFIDVEGTPMWWNYDGIWTVKTDPQTGQAAVESLSFTTIDSFLENIPTNNLRYVKGAYNTLTKIIQWVFRSTEAETVKENFQYDRVLNLSLINQSFYPWSFDSTVCNKIIGLFAIQGRSMEAVEENVLDNNGAIVTTGAGNVTVNRHDSEDISTRFKYITTSDCFLAPEPDSLTYNPSFMGYTPSLVSLADMPNNNIIIGEDGEYYLGAHTGDIYKFSGGTATLVNYSLATVQADVQAVMAFPSPSWRASRIPIAVPYTQYFYWQLAVQAPALTFYSVLALYKMDNTGTPVFQGCQAYSGSFTLTGAVADIVMRAVDYAGQPLADPTSQSLLVAMTLASTSSRLFEIPSVTNFIANSGDTGLWTDLFSPYFSEGYFFLNRLRDGGNENTNTCFFLPVDNGSSWSNWLCAFVSKAECDWINNGHAGFDATIAGYAAIYPNGFVIAKDITSGGSWTVINSHFKNEDTTDFIPYVDLGLNADDSDDGSALNDITTPSVQHDPTSGLSLLTWGRRYENIALNMSTTGAYVKVIVQKWSPESQSATFVAEAEGSPWNTETDLGGSSNPVLKYTNYPKTLMAFLSPDFTTVYIHGTYDGSEPISNKYILAKFGDLTVTLNPPQTGLTFSEFTNINYLDWQASGESQDFDSYFISGYKVHGDASRKFQANYINLWCRNDDFSEFDFNSRWDYSISGDSGRWSNLQRVTMDDTNFGYRTRRLKCRGHGKALQYKVTSVTGQPFDIVGWSAWETGNQAL